MISLIVAAAANGTIGKDGRIPWRLPGDLPRFKKLTMGHPVIMGRKTFESIGKPLPGRYNIVITRDAAYRLDGAEVSHSIERALKSAAAAAGGEEIFIIGGSEVYKAAMPLADRIYLTKVLADVDGDTFFSYEPSEWLQKESEKQSPDDKNPYPYEFCLLERIR